MPSTPTNSTTTPCNQFTRVARIVCIVQVQLIELFNSFQGIHTLGVDRETWIALRQYLHM